MSGLVTKKFKTYQKKISTTLTLIQGGVSYVPGVPFPPLSFLTPEIGTPEVVTDPIEIFLLSCSLYLLSLLLGVGRGACEGM